MTTTKVYSDVSDGRVSVGSSGWDATRNAATGSFCSSTDGYGASTAGINGTTSTNITIVEDFFAFDLSSIPPGAVINSATFTVYRGTCNSGKTLTLALQPASFTTLSTSSWIPATTLNGGIAISSLSSSNTSGFITFTITPSAVTTGGWFRFVLYDADMLSSTAVTTDDSFAILFADYGGTTFPPYVTIDWSGPPVESVGLTDSYTAFIPGKEQPPPDSVGLTDTGVVGYNNGFTGTDVAGLRDATSLLPNRLVSDNAAPTDSIVPEYGRTDTAGITDSILREYIPVADSTGLTDSSGIGYNQGFTATDFAGLSDSAQPIRLHAETDDSGLTDAVATFVIRGYTFTDSAGSTDVFNRTVQYFRTPSDAIGITDTESFNRSTSFTDATGGSDSAGPTYGYNRTYTDLNRLNDYPVYNHPQYSTDTANLSDDFMVSAHGGVYKQDGTGISDSFITSLNQKATITDDTGMSDGTSTSAVLFRTFQDDQGLGDSVVRQRPLIFSDSLGITDALTKDASVVVVETTLSPLYPGGSTFPGQVSPGSGSESVTTASVVPVSFTDPAGLVESVTEASSGARSITNSVGLADGVSRALSRPVVDTQGLVDVLAFDHILNTSLSDSEGLSDTAVAEITRPVSALDAEGISDSVILGRGHLATDTVAVTDSLLLGPGKTDVLGISDVVVFDYAPSLTDTTGAADNAVAGYLRAATMVDSLGAVDNIAYGRSQTVSDALEMFDGLGYGRDFIDDLRVTDATLYDFDLVSVESMSLADDVRVSFNDRDAVLTVAATGTLAKDSGTLTVVAQTVRVRNAGTLTVTNPPRRTTM